ncbi:MAG: Fe-S oxidoreductase [Candidatus Eremiobacter antarcticus]|nr:(Fe-S)-binding protein [Candidatus Eremiobacteraeota bacterium]MBC5807938.1 (Fe-S)-binding protein [Candidatus Eremiobacteraeota bacterium]PZR62695.1 MAG: Fe-S oxidoreductase [Candidatus Eremiobacter sp. RRmetagenome_bin22]
MSATASAFSRLRGGERVALFLPCYCDMLYPHIGQAMVGLFERLGVSLDYPQEQTCCGQPAFNGGSWPEARALARRFAKVFSPYPWIVVPSGSCAAMVKVFYPYIEAGAQADELGGRVFDLASFLVDVLGVVDVGATFAHSVTYHDGCHARRELKTSGAAVALLKAVRGLRYVPLPSIDECCGFGGLFSVEYERLSASMGRAKCDNILVTDADVVTSQDASCLMHLEGLLERQRLGKRPRTMHLAEILARP